MHLPPGGQAAPQARELPAADQSLSQPLFDESILAKTPCYHHHPRPYQASWPARCARNRRLPSSHLISPHLPSSRYLHDLAMCMTSLCACRCARIRRPNARELRARSLVQRHQGGREQPAPRRGAHRQIEPPESEIASGRRARRRARRRRRPRALGVVTIGPRARGGLSTFKDGRIELPTLSTLENRRRSWNGGHESIEETEIFHFRPIMFRSAMIWGSVI